MVRTKLKLLKKIYLKYFLLPYAINIYKHGQLFRKASFGAKGNYKKINILTKILVNNQPINHYDKYLLQKKAKIGIDCSGLCFHLLNHFSKLYLKKNIGKNLISPDYKYGPTKLNAKYLTNSTNSITIRFQDLVPGCLISTNNDKHVLFILESHSNYIKYIHSSRNANIPGVFVGYLFKKNNHHFFSDKFIETSRFCKPKLLLLN